MSETVKWTEKFGYKTTKGYINHLIKTGKIGSPLYQLWVEAGKPRSKTNPKIGFVYAEWLESPF